MLKPAAIYASTSSGEITGVSNAVADFSGAAVILSAAIAILHPVSDLFYYGCIIHTLIAIGLSFVDIIEHYNILSTRRLPQFDKKGGDDRA